LFTDLDFYDFPAESASGVKNRMIILNPASSDYIQANHFDGIRFHNVGHKNLAWFFDPPEKWANLADCGTWPCSGPKNTLMTFKNTEWIGAQPEGIGADF